MLSKEKILKELNDEIEFSKTCGMPQFTLGLIQAKSVVEKMKEE